MYKTPQPSSPTSGRRLKNPRDPENVAGGWAMSIPDAFFRPGLSEVFRAIAVVHGQRRRSWPNIALAGNRQGAGGLPHLAFLRRVT